MKYNNVFRRIWWKIVKPYNWFISYFTFMTCDCCEKYFLIAEYNKIPYSYELHNRCKYTYLCSHGAKSFKYQKIAATYCLFNGIFEQFLDSFEGIVWHIQEIWENKK